MKFAISIIGFLAVITIYVNAELTPEQVEKLTKAMAVCKPKTGATDADNKIDVEKIKEMAAPLKEKDAEKYDKGMKVIETCAAEANSESDECEVAKKMMECCKKEAAALGLSVKEFMEH
ncbi:hypothetical protein CBL_01037 [Carabus blaptoides fortunei]